MRTVLQTQRQRIRGLADRWSARFSHLPSWSTGFGGDKSQKQVYDELCALDLSTATVDDLRKIGSYLPSWVSAMCNGCHHGVAGDVVVFEEEADYDIEGYTLVLCRDCIVRGYDALPDATGSPAGGDPT